MALMHSGNTSGQQKQLLVGLAQLKNNMSKRGDVYH